MLQLDYRVLAGLVASGLVVAIISAVLTLI